MESNSMQSWEHYHIALIKANIGLLIYFITHYFNDCDLSCRKKMSL